MQYARKNMLKITDPLEYMKNNTTGWAKAFKKIFLKGVENKEYPNIQQN
jgi:hypothetical protein